MAQPGRTVVRQDRARRHRTRRLHFGARSKKKTHAIHPPVQQAAQTREVEILRHVTKNYYRINRYSPLVRSVHEFLATELQLARLGRVANLAAKGSERTAYLYRVVPKPAAVGSPEQTSRIVDDDYVQITLLRYPEVGAPALPCSSQIRSGVTAQSGQRGRRYCGNGQGEYDPRS